MANWSTLTLLKCHKLVKIGQEVWQIEHPSECCKLDGKNGSGTEAPLWNAINLSEESWSEVQQIEAPLWDSMANWSTPLKCNNLRKADQDVKILQLLAYTFTYFTKDPYGKTPLFLYSLSFYSLWQFGYSLKLDFYILPLLWLSSPYPFAWSCFGPSLTDMFSLKYSASGLGPKCMFLSSECYWFSNCSLNWLLLSPPRCCFSLIYSNACLLSLC